MALGMKVGLALGHIVLDGDPVRPLQKRGTAPPPIFSHVYCGQTADCIRIPLGTKVCLGPCHVALDGDPAPQKGAQQPPPAFEPMSVVAVVAHLSHC